MKTTILAAIALLCGTLLGAPARAQMVTGRDMKDFAATFDLPSGGAKPIFRATYAGSDVPGNILLPGESGTFRFQIENTDSAPLRTKARVELIAYGTKGIPGDIWLPQTVRFASLGSSLITVDIAPSGFADFAVSPRVPERKGGYALVLDLGDGRRQFLTTFVRTFAPEARRVQYPKFCLDELPLPVLQRLNTKAIRLGVSYKPTTDPDFPAWFAQQKAYLDDLKRANVAVLFMVGGGDFNHPNQPLGRPRPWLDAQGVMQDTKFDLAWTPDYDADFQRFTRLFADQEGWPRGPVNAFSLWNEPWEGISISGWGADLLRYREIYRHMAAGVLEARKGGAQVLVGGSDSTSNALDKFFGDDAGRREFLPIFDFLSIHYQGLSSSANSKLWRERQGYGGRVKIWDTESWVANTDDRVAAVVAGNRAAGYDRAMGVFGGNIADTARVRLREAGGEGREVETVQAWSTAAAIGASQHFLGERPFREMLFQNGLPFVMRFDGEGGRTDDGTLVVVGDLGEGFGAEQVPFRTARGFAEVRHKAELRAQLANFVGDAKSKATLQKQLNTPETLSGATMTLPASADYALFDPYGNAVAPQNGRISVPLDGRGFFLRPTGTPGSFARLLAASRQARVEGIKPLACVVHDFTAPLATRPALRVSLTNVLNRPVDGTLRVAVAGLRLTGPAALWFAPNQTKDVAFRVMGGAARPDNQYPLRLRFDAGRDGVVQHEETIRANVIAHLTPNLNGDLKAWAGALPQVVRAGDAGPSLTEAAWFSFKPFDAKTTGGIATGYLGYDARNFYFAVKIADATPDAGMPRFARRNDDSYFYPQTSYFKASGGLGEFSARWSGDIVAPTSGKYTFTTTSDDGVRLFIGGKAVVDNWTDHAVTENSGTVELVAGQKVPIHLDYYQGGGNATIRLEWSGPGRKRELVPTRALFPAPNADTQVGTGLRGELFAGRGMDGVPLVSRLDSRVDFTWQEGQLPDPVFAALPASPLQWPRGVRRYSYRRDPDLPSGNAPDHDNVQIAFNVLPPDKKPWLDKLPGVPSKFTTYWDTDYEYALNPVAPEFGGGTEVWRLQVPGMPRKHFYPRQPKWEGNGQWREGAVTKARLVIRREGNTRIVQAALPWSEIPDVYAAMLAKRPIKFSFRVNDNRGTAMELAQNRSASKRNNPAFHVDWAPHWANEIEFGWGK